VTGRLAKDQLDLLKSILGRCRTVLRDDLDGLLEGKYGIRPDGTLEAVSRLSVEDAERETRADLEGILDYFAAEGDAGKEGRERLVREAVFTHLNRLLAIRIAETLGLIPESIAKGRGSSGFRDILADVAPLLGADETGGYWKYLSLCGDELAADAPVLFDPRNPLLALEPGPRALDKVVAQLAPPYDTESGESLWSAADTLGWAYQFFNTDQERRQMHANPAPRSSRELAVRNQFFTPDYVVRYIVQNSLGRRLVEADAAPGLIDDLDWLVDPPRPDGTRLNLDALRVLDPACGSGHFLLGAYDLLESAWLRRRVAPDRAAERIVPALWGIDIDPRAVQVAAAAIVLRARRACGRLAALPAPNVACARAMPPIPKELEDALPSPHRRLLDELRSELDRAPVLGSLLKVEDVLAERAAGTATASFRGTPPLSIADAAADEAAAVREEVLAFVQRAADLATSTPAERLRAAEATDALRFVQAMRQRYDAVLMNPPFGEPVEGTKPYLKKAYPWAPTKDANLSAVFVGRGLELCNEHGYVGAITSRAGMFLTTYQAWRTEILLGHDLVTLADLGFGVMEGALVEAAAYVLGAGGPDQGRPATFLRLLRVAAAERGRVIGEVIEAIRKGAIDNRVFRVASREFDAVPGKPLAYWMTPSVRRLFTNLPPIEGNAAYVRQGLATGDDPRFVRAMWEVDPRRIALSRAETLAGKRWVPFVKGGEYSPFWSDVHLVVDWENDGERIRGYEGSRPQNTQYFFQSGITWPRRTASGFSPRVMPAGCIFADKGPAMVPLLDGSVLLAWVTSRVAGALLAVQLGAADETSSGAASKSYEVGLVGRLPWPRGLETERKLAAYAAEITTVVKDLDRLDETTHSFVGPNQAGMAAGIGKAAQDEVSRIEDVALMAIRRSAAIEEAIMSVIGSDAAAFVEEEMGPHPATLPEAAAPRLDGVYELPIDELIANGMRLRGGLRTLTQKTFVAERRMEILAHSYGVHPGVIAEERRRLGLLPPGTARDMADRYASYLVGCALGRWDIRQEHDFSSVAATEDPFDPLPVCPPAMLVDADGFPWREPVPGYPLDLPPQGVLLDEPGHRLDLVAAMEKAAACLVAESGSLLDEMTGILGRDLREHLRRQFFKDHLGRYTKSRRKAPIYWPLTLPSRTWGLWVYAPKLTRETLFAVEAAADQRLGSAVIEIRRLEGMQLEAGGRATRELARRLEAERKLAEELRLFHREARRISGLGWIPNLDDGIVLCAAPLADLFPDWSGELLIRRSELRRGAYPWATVSRYREVL
jgi:SAM-dependent methyltransferase